MSEQPRARLHQSVLYVATYTLPYWISTVWNQMDDQIHHHNTEQRG